MAEKLSETTYTTTVEVTGGRQGHARSSDGNLDVDLQRPGQPDEHHGGTNPEQLFAAGYAACFQSALMSAARRAGKDASGSVIESTVSMGTTTSGGYGLAVQFDITIPGVDQATAEELVTSAHQTCPYSNATRGNIDVSFNVSV